MTQTIQSPRSTTSIVLLIVSLLVGAFGLAVCLLARNLFMKSTPEWFAMNYTPMGWVLRALAATAGTTSLLIALWVRPIFRKKRFRKWFCRVDVALALTAIAFEIAMPVILVIAIIGSVALLGFRTHEHDSSGCLVGSIAFLDFFDFFDFFDSDD